MEQPILLRHGLGSVAGNPLTSEVEIAQFLQRECGADGYRIENNMLLALRWDSEGYEVVIDRFDIAPAPRGRA